MGEHRHGQFITDFYREVMCQPRDYSTLLGALKATIVNRHCETPTDRNAHEILRHLWHQIGSEVETSGRLYSDFMKIMIAALRSCPESNKVYYR